MVANILKLIPSGIEPVDELLGGLERGQLYLVHGDASGKAMFGIKFLIEGLKRGETGALVIRYSPEDAVRRFARLGYDCLEDIYSGRLVILEYSNEIIQDIARLREIKPVLRELEWLLGERRPQRLIFDPVTHLVVGEEGDLASRVQEFATWARSFGATVALIANGDNEELIRDFRPLVRESFRFDLREIGDCATRLLVFEKSDSLPDQRIEVDPARGVFLVTKREAGVPEQKVARPPIDEPSLEAAATTSNVVPFVSIFSSSGAVEESARDTRPTADEEDSTEARLTADEEDSTEARLTADEEDSTDARLAADEEDSTDARLTADEEDSTDARLTADEDDSTGARLTADEDDSTDARLTADEDDSTEAHLTADEDDAIEAFPAADESDPTDLLTSLANAYEIARAASEALSSTTTTETPHTPMLAPEETGKNGDGPFPFQEVTLEGNAYNPDVAAAAQTERLSLGASELAAEPFLQDMDPLGADFFELDLTREVAARPSPTAVGDSSLEKPRLESGLQSPEIEKQAESAPLIEPLGSSVPDAAGLDGQSDAWAKRDLHSTLAARAVEMLLRSPETAVEAIRVKRHAEAPLAISPEVTAGDCHVLVIDDDPDSRESISRTLDSYAVETVPDGISGLAKLISFKPDLVVLNMDLAIIDGFKILGHIRSSLNTPIIAISASHLRASDRVLSTELGADYYITRPFSINELRQKARQLIGRHRGIASWIVAAPAGNQSNSHTTSFEEPPAQRRGGESVTASALRAHDSDSFVAYAEFVARVEEGVKAAIETGLSFSIVGCRVPNMTSGGGQPAIKLLEFLRPLVRDTDVISTNPRNEIVVLLANSEAAGARAFVSRLRQRISKAISGEMSVWMRSFPDLEAKGEPPHTNGQ